MVNEMNQSMATESVLRRLAEGRIAIAEKLERREVVDPAGSQQLIHNLRVHQVQLEMQNEVLRRTQAELDAARSLYFDLYDLAPVGYCTISETEHILEVNLTVCTLLGLTRDKLIGRSVRQFIYPPDQDTYYLHRKKLAATGQPQSCELRLIDHDGAIFWASLQATLSLEPEHHDIQRMVLINIDKRKVAEDRLRVSDTAIKAILQGVVITTPELRVISANQAFLTMTGYLESELLGFDCVRLNGPLTDPVTIAAFPQGD
jgi:PAS domain S-box-containing protein